MGRTTQYLFVIWIFIVGIVVVLVMIFVLIQRNEINTLRSKLATCSSVQHDCIDQLGVFYVDPEKNGKKINRLGINK